MLLGCEPSANTTEVKLDAPPNTSCPMLVTVDGMVMEVNFDAPLNAYCPILVNLEPASNVTEVNFVAPLNTNPPILITLDGMVMEVKAVARWNAAIPMLVTSVPTDTDFMLLIGMLLGTVRVPDVAAVVCVVPSVRVNVVGVAVFTTNVAVIVSEV